MRRRSSGSATDEDDDSSAIPDAPAPPAPVSRSPEHGNDLTTYTPRTSTDGVAKERRRNNETVARASLTKSRVWSEAHTAPAPEKDLQRKMLDKDIIPDDMAESYGRRRSRWRNPWSISTLTLAITVAAFVALFAIVQSFFTRQLDPKGCDMSRMWAAFVKYDDFDTEHTRFASKYSLYMYREGGIDEDTRVGTVCIWRWSELTGYRSREFPSSSFPATREATSKCALWPPRLRIISTTTFKTNPTLSRMEREPWTSSRSTLTRTSQLSTDRRSWTKPST